ncbi:MAG: cell division protein FtsL [Oscillospiraceae bacterium]|jgi:cell division protein FtsL|nr:cell division protein FtsL [Oscillospiraceae bacterium]
MNTNLAYKKHSDKKPEQQQTPKSTADFRVRSINAFVATKNAVARNGNAFLYTLALVAALVIPFISVASRSELNEEVRELEVVNSELSEAQSETARLTTILESKAGISDVEAYAKDVLGMQKVSAAQEVRISVPPAKISVAAKSSEAVAADTIRQKLTDFWNNLFG